MLWLYDYAKTLCSFSIHPIEHYSASEILSQSESVLRSPDEASPELNLLRSAPCASSGLKSPSVLLLDMVSETLPSL